MTMPCPALDRFRNVTFGRQIGRSALADETRVLIAAVDSGGARRPWHVHSNAELAKRIGVSQRRRSLPSSKARKSGAASECIRVPDRWTLPDCDLTRSCPVQSFPDAAVRRRHGKLLDICPHRTSCASRTRSRWRCHRLAGRAKADRFADRRYQALNEGPARPAGEAHCPERRPLWIDPYLVATRSISHHFEQHAQAPLRRSPTTGLASTTLFLVRISGHKRVACWTGLVSG